MAKSHHGISAWNSWRPPFRLRVMSLQEISDTKVWSRFSVCILHPENDMQTTMWIIYIIYIITNNNNMSTQCRKYPKMKENDHDPQICGFQAPKTYNHDKPPHLQGWQSWSSSLPSLELQPSIAPVQSRRKRRGRQYAWHAPWFGAVGRCLAGLERRSWALKTQPSPSPTQPVEKTTSSQKKQHMHRCPSLRWGVSEVE